MTACLLLPFLVLVAINILTSVTAKVLFKRFEGRATSSTTVLYAGQLLLQVESFM